MLFRKNKKLISGFTLIEMIVVIGIFVLFTSIMLADYKSFGDNEKFINLVYDNALTVRQIQTNGIAVKDVSTGGDVFNAGFGLHFNPSAALDSYIGFADLPDPADNDVIDYAYDVANDTLLKTYTLDPGYSIKKVCAILSDKTITPSCADDAGGVVDIVFVRPNPDAIISYNKARSDDSNHSYVGAKIYITSPKNVDKIIYVDATGQISVQ